LNDQLQRAKLDIAMAEDAKPAPGDLEHVREFVNTLDLETHEEQLADTDALGAWLAGRGLIAPAGEPLTPADVRQAQSLRESLRKLLLANNGAELDPAAVDALNAAARSAELVVRLDASGSAGLAPVRPGIDGALGRLLAVVFRSMADGTWQRLKACPDHDCEWAFYDWSKNRSGTWCDMRVCGNRAKARAFRERRQRGNASNS
jgi:predicted RNA-binding Zn ribbon-like protein